MKKNMKNGGRIRKTNSWEVVNMMNKKLLRMKRNFDWIKVKVFAATCLIIISALSLVACTRQTDVGRTKQVGSTLADKQQTPKDISFSLTRYSLIRRAYWLNGKIETAKQLPCDVVKPRGHIELLTANGVYKEFDVDGIPVSLQTYLTPDSECYSASYTVDWLPDVDGTYGDNCEGIFFFDVDGVYHEWTGQYLYTSRD